MGFFKLSYPNRPGKYDSNVISGDDVVTGYMLFNLYDNLTYNFTISAGLSYVANDAIVFKYKNAPTTDNEMVGVVNTYNKTTGAINVTFISVVDSSNINGFFYLAKVINPVGYHYFEEFYFAPDAYNFSVDVSFPLDGSDITTKKALKFKDYNLVVKYKDFTNGTADAISTFSTFFNEDLETTFTGKSSVFDFMVKNDYFYINTPGVSIDDSTRSSTNINDGLFRILNKNNKAVFFGNLALTSVKFRGDTGNNVGDLKCVLDETTTDSGFQYDKYLINFKGNDIGKLTIRRDLIYSDGSGTVISPFQSIELGAIYEVLSTDNSNIHYFGQSPAFPNKTIGVIDVNYTIVCYEEQEMLTSFTEPLTFTITTVKNS